MELWLLILIIVISSILVLSFAGWIIFSFAISDMMAKKFCTPKHFKTKEEKLLEMSQIKDLDGVDQYTRIPIEFKMSDGYIIHGDYSLNNKKKFVIMLHGHTSNREGSVKYSYPFYRLGYSLIFIDHRSHGENERTIVTMGYQEHKDVLEVVEQVKEKFGQDVEVGLFGCSMGGATALLCVKENQRLSFVVSDCAFSSLENMVIGLIKAHKNPSNWPVLQITESYFKKRYCFSYKETNPVESVKENKEVPILFIHGLKDDLVYKENADILYKACGGPKRLEFFPEAVHCGSIISDKERYYKVVEEFLKENKRI